ncbi:MAG: radical SAM protein [Streptococcaceae bacterium]|jgi:MoaA/NifB/PqqE/SkfB family radical SAM enzyme|nr:radical SAM protein [Streptococcaceae bacterium]
MSINGLTVDGVILEPESAAIITTYKCTARCKDCCFDCSPKEKEMLTIDEIKKFIDEIAPLKSIKSVVWTGGECSILGKKLEEGIAYAKSKGKISRIVSNGSWSSGVEKDKIYLNELKSKGLAEINLSTGDNHQQFIPIEKVLTIAQAAVSVGLRVLISVEKTKFSKFSIENLKEHPIYKKIKRDDKDTSLSLLSAAWVSFNSGSNYEYDEEAFIEKREGCDSLYNTIAINPEKKLLACCGITIRYIPEMEIGILGEKPIIDMYNVQKSDFMKQWIFTEGPINILRQVVEWEDTIEIPKFVHPCQACAYIYQTPEIIEVIEKNYHTIIERITVKFYQKISFKGTFEKKLKAKAIQK